MIERAIERWRLRVGERHVWRRVVKVRLSERSWDGCSGFAGDGCAARQSKKRVVSRMVASEQELRVGKRVTGGNRPFVSTVP